MKKKLWLSLVTIASVVLAFLGLGSVNSSPVHAAKKGEKVLVVYFSRTQGVYDGPLKKGNTAQVARFIQQKTNADIYEIVPQKSYPNSYKKTADVAQQEQKQNARPAIKGTLPDVSKYDTVFIGSPVWWSSYPMVVRTFLDKESGLNGKTLIPFTTAEGSGLADTASILKKQFPDSKVRKGFTTRGDSVKNHPGKVHKRVNSWLGKLGY